MWSECFFFKINVDQHKDMVCHSYNIVKLRILYILVKKRKLTEFKKIVKVYKLG